ncbi:MAG: pyrimidine 5'-nucleotidase [Desulfuromonadales bacterium]|nr:pyrimidine 5'-nucleotidase [Desulfuromonadales bacterium]
MDILIFDLDNTLYPAEKQLFNLIDVRINRYMTEIVGIPAPKVDALRREYWCKYGVTLQGLIRHHDVDPEDYLSYVHDVDVRSRLQPDHTLREALHGLSQRKAVFTNGSVCHAQRVLGALGIEDMFEQIFDIRIAAYQPKPCVEPYHAVLAELDAEPQRCVMIEDNRDNLKTAKNLGMGTVLVGVGATPAYVDVHLDSASQISQALQHWDQAS